VVRKTVTVLFADVTGSTAMGERSDPEALRRVMTGYFEVSRLVLERHGATVEKFIGDAVMAVFGIPAVHEDDALRAARAALELRRDVSALGIELRIGVNTGEVVADAGETLVTGDAVNVAARLQQGAEPGEILLGAATHALAGHALRTEAVAPLHARGKSAPVAAWRLVDVEVGDPAFGRVIRTPFVGRQSELGLLMAAWDATARAGGARRVTVLGAPGIGKSRLTRELVAHVGGAARVVVGRCVAYGEGITYLPLAEIVHSTAGASRESIAGLVGDELVADRIAAIVGAGGMPGSKEETQWAARQYLEALAQDQPLLVLLDDLHWAEQTFLDLVEYVADFATVPILLVCTARGDLLDQRPSWTAPRPNVMTLVLEPLSTDEAAALIPELDDEARTRILDAAEGNPLFVEQIVALRSEAAGSGDLAIPPSLQALLAARIDSLAAAERIVIERASIEGRFFHRGSVVELAPEAVKPAVGAHLLTLVRKEFVRPDRAQFPGDDGYRFVHALVRDAAYAALSKELRADLHEQFADWLERVAADRLDEMEEIVAYHLEQAALNRRELDLPDERQSGRRAAELLARSGTRAFDRGDLSAAENLLGRAVALLPAGDPLRIRALPMLGAAIFDAAGGIDRAFALIAQGLDESRIAGDHAAEASAWALHGVVTIFGVPEADIEELARTVEARAPEIERRADPRSLVYLRRLQLAIATTRHLDIETAASRLFAAARTVGDRPNALEALFFVCASGVLGPTPVDDALAASEQRFRGLAQGPLEEAAVAHMEGLLRGMKGEFDAGLQIIRKTRATFAEFGPKMTAVGSARDEALIARYAGDFAAAERTLRTACDQLRALGETSMLSLETGELADALYELERLDEAAELNEECARLAQDADYSTQALWRRVRAKLLARAGDHDEALRLACEAIERAGSSLEELGDAYLDLAVVERLAGRAGQEQAALERALALYERKGMGPMANRARAQLGRVRAGR
jgi:class 3 adenylate cyclase/tetratricopeptide (TPR) repeat protein